MAKNPINGQNWPYSIIIWACAPYLGIRFLGIRFLGIRFLANWAEIFYGNPGDNYLSIAEEKSKL